MLIDEVKIIVEAGKGGDGKVAFDTSKGGRGVTGGSGGRGGDVYFECVSDLSALRQFRFKKLFSAKNGENGRPKTLDGADGEDLVLMAPIGTVIHFIDPATNGEIKEKRVEIVKAGERVLVARGGRGGRGNFHFKGPSNTSPKQFEFGRKGEQWELFLELQLIADAGLIGLPNAGKSSLLNELTSANVKVANYPFTTLEPNLGAFYEADYADPIILADIPGLIEGASKGRGLGHKFLRHIERTNILLHCIASDSPDPLLDYKTIRKELEEYKKELSDKKEYIIFTKTDLISSEDLQDKIKIFKKKKMDVLVVSIYDPEAMAALRVKLSNLKK